MVEEFEQGDQVFIKNRRDGALEMPLVGPYEFVAYKDYDKYAAILRDEDTGKTFDCAVTHLVPVLQ